MTLIKSFIRLIGAWLVPGTKTFDLMRIFVVCMTTTFFYLYFGAFVLFDGAFGYEVWADALVSGASLVGYTQLHLRDVGMPLIMLIGGFPFTHSLIGVTIIQGMMAIAMPLLAYSAIHPWFPRTAYFIAIVSVICLAPIILFKTIHHDQPYIFFSVLSMWLVNRYTCTQRPAYLYGMTLAVFAMTLVRIVGKSIYPFVWLVCLLENRQKGNIRHFVVSILLFIVCVTGYSSYRDKVMGNPPSVLGLLTFYNIYLNSAELGVKLSPDIGPNMKLVFEHAYKGLLPSPAEAEYLKGGPSTPDFTAEHFYKYSADELLDRMFSVPNFEYYLFIQSTVDDRVLLMASIETALAHPLFVVKYTLRNAWDFLYDPGWEHGRFATKPQFKGGLLFPFGGITTAGLGNVGDRTPNPSLQEVSFIPLSQQPEWLKDLYYSIEVAWYRYYHPLTKVAFYLCLVAWFSTCIGFLHRIFRTAALAYWSKVLNSERTIPASLGVTALLLSNIGVTAAFEDPRYRYDFSLLMFKVMLAGIGCAILLHVLFSLLPTGMSRMGMSLPRFRHSVPVETETGAGRKPAAEPGWHERHVVPLWAFLVLLMIIGFWGWADSLMRVAVAEKPAGTINVISATFGANCGERKDNALQYLRSACLGKQQCTYLFDLREVGPPSTCSKEFQFEWKCSQTGPTESRVVSPQPAQGTPVPLACQ